MAKSSPVPRPAASIHRRWRFIKDILARYGVAIGGVGVIVAIVLIFFYLFYIVLPLLKGAEAEPIASYKRPGGPGQETLYLAMEEQAEIAVRFTRSGQAIFFRTTDGGVVQEEPLRIPASTRITSFAAGDPGRSAVAFGLANGKAVVARHTYKVTYPENQRTITPGIEYPVGDTPILVDPRRRPLARIAVQSNEEATTLVGVTDDGRVILVHLAPEELLLGESTGYKFSRVELDRPQRPVLAVLLDKDQQELYVADTGGGIMFFDITDKSTPRLIQRLRVTAEDDSISALAFLTGGISLLVGSTNGKISQWFPVRDENNNVTLTRIRDFDAHPAAISAIAPEHNRKGFLAADRSGGLGIYHATAHRTLLTRQVSETALTQLAVAPRADALLAEDGAGRMHFWRVDNEHPEVSWSSLWGKVWYESYAQPEYVWQSSSASNDFEPKFSLTPLSFGTLKAAFYAMLLAAPLAIMGAVFTAYFMAPRMRTVVKPAIEIMEALPTVILGFLAGLWLAPFVEKYLPGVFALLIVLPLGIFIFAYTWNRLPGRWRHTAPVGWEAALLIPVIILIGWAALAFSPALEQWWFAGDMRLWLTNEMGVAFDQRNAIVVGLIMGFAVIPTIFSITEDAIFAVPRHLTQGSLALGATPWQTLVRVVLLTASPGIFSAVMIGLGRAVGETMIVLMATGNTPVMDWSIFQGMRTLSANIAVEMPEAEVGSTHYRVLFLAALVLFLFTFLVNTLAEIIRQRLRRKYSTL